MGQQLNEEGGEHLLVAVAIDKDKSSQNALKWALENLVVKGQTITLIHVNTQGLQSHLPPFQYLCIFFFLNCSNIFETTNAIESISIVVANVVLGQQNEASANNLFIPFRCFCTRKDVSNQRLLIKITPHTYFLFEITAHLIFTSCIINTIISKAW